MGNKNLLFICFMIVLVITGCRDKARSIVAAYENKEAKAMLQGIWINSEMEDVAFKMKGDSIFYPDSTSLPSYFRVMADTLCIGNNSVKYPILKLTNNTFWFRNPNSDVVKLVKSDNPDNERAFIHEKTKPVIVTEKLKTDTIVMYNNERYHSYIAVNPTTYKVVKTVYNDDGVKVDNIYYDNIIHISVFNGAKRLYSRDFNKKMYSSFVPESFLNQAVLSNIEFSRVDAKGLHFNTIICIPDGASCYMLDTRITFDGAMSMELIEY